MNNEKSILVRKISFIKHKEKKLNTVVMFHAHHSYAHEFIYVDYGKIILTAGDKKIKLKTGDCVFIPGALKHSFRSEADTHFDFLNVMFRGKIPDLLCCRALSVNSKGIELLEQMKEEEQQQMPYFNDFVICCMTELMILLYRQETSAVPRKIPDTVYHRQYRSDFVNKALTLISMNYAEPLTLTHLSKAVGISEPHLRASLKKETGDNFSAILHKHRIAAAKSLVKDEMPIQQVVSAVGYKSSSFFFKIFRRVTGMSPKEYLNSLGSPAT